MCYGNDRAMKHSGLLATTVRELSVRPTVKAAGRHCGHVATMLRDALVRHTNGCRRAVARHAEGNYERTHSFGAF
jgi:hypothetical protein